MSAVITPLVSIVTIAILAWAARRVLGVRVCPICAGVAGTWSWMLVGRELGGSFDASLLPFLMGGSVVGIVYQLEALFPAGRSSVLWKSAAMPIGFVAAYALERQQWTLLVAALAAIFGIAALLRRGAPAPAGDGASVAKLKEQMKQCC